ncbi:dihydroorotate dehydrogenase [Rubrobacter naiadicus]|uniref:dihydroorotate dehydrogenase n=1 Tax=Rubrobacter naiadicus TaxID=1392641 RepID=UPI00235DEF4C|nr:dihydroorotate dehydrogenase [Rubrobacter naiadicus]
MVRETLEVELCGLRLRTPLVPAAGTLSREELPEVAGAFGAVLPKTVTLEPRPGNPPPRIAEAPSGMINSIGLENPGLDAFLSELDLYDVGLPVFVSVAGETPGEFARVCRRLAGDERVAAVELNLSCPNTERGEETFCSHPPSVEEVVSACREAMPQKPLFAKLASERVLENSLAAGRAGADAVTLINTIPALAVDARTRRVFLAGGLSGPAIKPVALRCVHQVSRTVEVPVIGCGGVVSGTDVAEFMLAGATAVQVGSGSFVRDVREILEGFLSYLEENGLRARDLTAGSVPLRRPVGPPP